MALEIIGISSSILCTTMTGVWFACLSMLLAIPTLVAGFYGMNVPIPGEDRPNQFLRIISTCLAVIRGLLWYFRWQKWV